MIRRIFREFKRGFPSAILITILIMTVVNYVKIIDVETDVYWTNKVNEMNEVYEKIRLDRIDRQVKWLGTNAELNHNVTKSTHGILEAQNDLILSNQLLLEDELRALALLIR